MADNSRRRHLLVAYLLLIISTIFSLTACGEAAPTPFPSVTRQEDASPSPPTATPSPLPPLRFQSEGGDVALTLPGEWETALQGITTLGAYYSLGPAPLGPGPASSALFIAPEEELTPEKAAAILACGTTTCAQDITFEETRIGNYVALRASIGDSPALEWFFVEAGGRLVTLSLHDPTSYETRGDLLETLQLSGTALPTATVPPSPTPAATPSPTAIASLPPVREWRAVNIDGAEMTFALPAQANEQSEGRWNLDEANDLILGFSWQQVPPDTSTLALLPADAEVLASEPYSVTWGSGISATVTLAERWQRHALLGVGLRSFDFFVEAPQRQALSVLQPILSQVIESVTIEAILPYVATPTDGAVAFFRAVLDDPTGAEARPYLANELAARLDELGSPLALLDLDQRFHTFDIEWNSAGGNNVEMEATLILLDDTVVVRRLTLADDELLGWRIVAIEPLTEEPSGDQP